MTEDLAIYVIRPNKDVMNILSEIHFVLKAMHPNAKECIIFVPKENYDIIEYMSTNHIDDIKIKNFNVDLIPIDLDLHLFRKRK